MRYGKSEYKNNQTPDQKLEKGHLSLVTSIMKWNELRLIKVEEDPTDQRKRYMYVYRGFYGLYLVMLLCHQSNSNLR